MIVVVAEGTDVAEMANKVIECSFDPETETWTFMRIRYDKETPNAYHVYLKVGSTMQYFQVIVLVVPRVSKVLAGFFWFFWFLCYRKIQL